MSVAPAGVQPSSSMQVAGPHWGLGAVVALLVAITLIVVGLAIRLDDGSSRSDVTTTPTSQVNSPSAGLSGSDLGGSIHRRGGNQP